MEPALSIITRCGGYDQVAGWLCLNKTTVLRWTLPRGQGGTNGLIPSKHQMSILARAKAEDIRLEPADFFPRDIAA